MIHSLAGGVIADNELHTFLKVQAEDVPRWYLAPYALAPGRRVLVPVGHDGRAAEGVVLRTERCTRQTAPVPLVRARSVLRVLPDGDGEI